MTSLSKVLGGRLVLSVALGACACQHDSVAKFDDVELPGPATGGAQGAAGSLALGGESAAGGDDTSGAGSSAEAGTTAAAGKGGSSKGGEGNVGGAAGGAGKPSTAGEGGSSGSAVAGGGTGGNDPEPEPVTVTTQDFADTYVASCMSSNFGEEQTLNVDAGNGCIYQTLMNPSLADVPDGALVSAATLTLHCVNVGAGLTVFYVDEAWTEDTVRWNTRPEVSTKLADLTCEEMGDVTLDLTAAVKAWVSGARAANGFRISTEGEDGTDFTSSEYFDVGERPSLSITYTLPVK